MTLSNLLLGAMLLSMWMMSAWAIRACGKTMKAPQPGMTGAMMLVLLASAGSVAMQFALGMTVGFSAFGFRLDPAAAAQLKLAMAAPIWMIVSACVYRAMLPTTFGKAMIMFLCQAALIGMLLTAMAMVAHLTQMPALAPMRQLLPM